MKATGIVRRIDDLGRVVIPKEIRRTMRIREGDPLEIYTDREGEVIFKKYSPIGELNNFAGQYAETLYKTCDLAVVICDRDSVIACAGVPKRDFLDKHLSPEADGVIEGRSLYRCDGNTVFSMVQDGSDAFTAACIMPIMAEGDVIGCVANLLPAEGTRRTPTEIECKLVESAAGFLGRQMEP